MNTYNDFYLTLLSNSSINYFPKNTSAHFYNQLPKTIHLNGEWCVGLSEVQYPCSFVTVNDDKNIIYCTYEYDLKEINKYGTAATISFLQNVRVSEWTEYQARKKGYATVEKFIAAISEGLVSLDNNVIGISYKTKIEAGNYDTIESVLKTLNENEILNGDGVHFSLNTDSKKVNVKSSGSSLSSLSFSPALNLQLGFEPGVNVLNKTSPYPANLMLGTPSQLFVYTDLIEPQLIGDIMAKVIRVVVIDNKRNVFGTYRNVEFPHPHYVPVLKREFENIEIDLRTATGEKVPFLFGTVCVKLHFKKIS